MSAATTATRSCGFHRVAHFLAFSTLLSPADLEGQRLVDVYAARPGERLFISAPYQRGLAVTRNRTIWLAVRIDRGPSRKLLCLRSVDGGRTFLDDLVLGAPGAYNASLVADPHQPILHATWSAPAKKTGWTGVYYQAVDSRTAKLVGKPELLLPGTGPESQFYAGDFECMDDGTLALTAHAHRSPAAPAWKKQGWSAGLLLRKPAAPDWQDPILINRGYSGVCPTIHHEGTRLFFSYRSGGSKDFGIYFREYDVARAAWSQADEVPIAYSVGHPRSLPANTSCLSIDASGNKYVLHSMNRDGRGRDVGRLQFAYAPAGRRGRKPGPWRLHQDLAASPGESSENITPQHYALARGPGDMMYAIYSKPSDQHARLYVRTLEHGRLVTEEKVVAKARPQAFVGVTAFRSRQADTTLLAAVVGKTAKAPHGRVAILVQGMPVRSYWRAGAAAGPAKGEPRASAGPKKR